MDAERPDAGRRQLQRQRDPVEPPAQSRDGGQGRPWIQAKAVGQQAAQLAVTPHRLGLPAGPVEGQHVRGAQSLPQRVTGHQLAELAGQQAVLAQRQPGLGVVFHRDQPLLLQPRDRRLGEQRVGEVRQRRASPQSQRIGQKPGPVPGILGRAGPLGQGGEPVLVQRVTAGPEQVAR